MGIGVADVGQGPLDFDFQAGFRFQASFNLALIGFTALDRNRGKLPQAAQKPVGRALYDQHGPLFENYSDGDVAQGHRGSALAVGVGCRGAVAMGQTVVAKRAVRTVGVFGAADQGAQFHDGLVEIGRTVGADQSHGRLPEHLVGIGAVDRRVHLQQPCQDPLNVTVHDGHWPVEGDAQHGGGDVITHTGQGSKQLRVVGNPPLKTGDHQAGGAVQVAGPGIVTESFPQFEDLLDVGGSQIGRCGKAVHEALVIGDRGGHLGLLQHDLRDPYGIGVGRLPPGQAPAVAGIPGQQVGAYLLCCH